MVAWTVAAEWAACVFSMAGAWLLSSRGHRVHFIGFAAFTVSNLVMVAWALHEARFGILTTQAFFTVTSLRGMRRTWQDAACPPCPTSAGSPSPATPTSVRASA